MSGAGEQNDLEVTTIREQLERPGRCAVQVQRALTSAEDNHRRAAGLKTQLFDRFLRESPSRGGHARDRLANRVAGDHGSRPSRKHPRRLGERERHRPCGTREQPVRETRDRVLFVEHERAAGAGGGERHRDAHVASHPNHDVGVLDQAAAACDGPQRGERSLRRTR